MIKYIIGFILIFVFLVIGLTIGANNDQTIIFNYLIAQSELKLSTLIALLFGSGLILGWLISFSFYLKIKYKNFFLNRQLKQQSKGK